MEPEQESMLTLLALVSAVTQLYSLHVTKHLHAQEEGHYKNNLQQRLIPYIECQFWMSLEVHEWSDDMFMVVLWGTI